MPRESSPVTHAFTGICSHPERFLSQIDVSEEQRIKIEANLQLCALDLEELHAGHGALRQQLSDALEADPLNRRELARIRAEMLELFNQSSSRMLDTLQTNFGYGGLLVEYYFFPRSVVHLSLGVVLGAGGLLFAERMNGDHDDFEGDVLFVAEPEIGLYLNVTSFFRLGATVSYRYVTDVDTADLSEWDLSGFSGGLSFSFGGF